MHPGPNVDHGPVLTLAHGFTQNSRCWGEFESALVNHVSSSHQIQAVDLPGHGQSSHDDADLDHAGRLLAAAGSARPEVVLGYSMGGRVALHRALNPRPNDQLAGLVLIGATGGIEDDDERAARRRRDEELADRIINEGVSTFLDGWLANPLFAGLSAAAHCRDARETNRPEGLAASLHNCGTGTQRFLLPELSTISVPVLVLVGQRDAKFLVEGTRLVTAIGTTATMATVADAGHACHLEQPANAATRIAEWLREIA